MTTTSKPSLWKRLSLPQRVGLLVAALAMLLVLVGIVRGAVPLNFVSIALALLISGGSWGLVAWAVTTAATDVEQDIAAGNDQ